MFFAWGAVVIGTTGCGNGGSGGSGGASSSVTSTGTTTSGTSGTTTSTGASNPMDCATSAHATCAKRDSCSTNGFSNDHVYGSESICEMRAAAGCDDNLNAAGAGPSVAVACSAAMMTETCTDFFDDDPPMACITTGTQPTGAACGQNGQCASTFCALGPLAVCGTCQPLPAAGATCLAVADCGRDMACVKPAGSTTLTQGTCAPWVLENDPCDSTKSCADGLDCVGATTTTCQKSGATVDAACDRSQKTAAACDANLGLTCIPTGAGSSVGTCQTVQLVAANATCGVMGTPVTSVADCSDGGLCVKAMPTDKTGTCAAPAADGAACNADPSMGPPCLSPAKCVPTAAGMTAGTCTMPHAATCM